jgi:hypothetical protein
MTCAACGAPLTGREALRHFGFYVKHMHDSECVWYLKEQERLALLWMERNDCS